MVSKLQKMRDRLMAKKGNKGFTLVELIVVIVILAILVGVTIGGVYGYVNKSRINTDINNASAIASAMAPITTMKYVTTDASLDGTTAKVTISSALTTVDATALGLTVGTGAPADTANNIKNMFPQGIDAPKTAGAAYKIYYTSDASGHITSVKCVAEDSTGSALLAQE